ncbi:MAG: TadE/TadG family type IV pilus assembly protein [Bryobacteraceae bacterium]
MTGVVREEEGSEIIEFSLVIIPLFGFLFLIVSVCWVIFAQATLQYAATAGVRFAITRQSNAAIQALVQQDSLGFITATNQIKVTYYNPSNLQPVPSNAPGNLVQVKVLNVPIGPLAPILGGTSTPTLIPVSAADVME